MYIVDMNVDTDAMSPVAQEHSTSIWTWNGTLGRTNQYNIDSIAQSQAVEAASPAKITCLSISNSTMEVPRLSAIKVDATAVTLVAQASPLPFWNWNDIPRHSDWHDSRTRHANLQVDVIFQIGHNPIWTWNDIPRHSSCCVIGSYAKRTT
jgi:hypothetical protein